MELNKQFEYKGYRFNISIKLNTHKESDPNGGTYHAVVTNDMGATNFYKTTKFLELPNNRARFENELIETIALHTKEAEKFVDNRELKDTNSLIEKLNTLGFE